MRKLLTTRKLLAGAIFMLATFQVASTTAPTRYVALLSQSGTNAPVATVKQNSLGGEITWSRVGGGVYLGTLLQGTFGAGRTTVVIGNELSPTRDFAVVNVGKSQEFIQLHTADVDVAEGTAVPSDGMLSNTTIEIRVYPK